MSKGKWIRYDPSLSEEQIKRIKKHAKKEYDNINRKILKPGTKKFNDYMRNTNGYL